MEVLRLLTINDEHCVMDVASAKLDPKTLALVRLAALVSVGGSEPSYGAEADAAVNAGATAAEIVEVLVGVVSVVGLPRVVAAAPKSRHGARVQRQRCVGGAVAGVSPGYPPSRPIAIACCTASLREETPSFR